MATLCRANEGHLLEKGDVLSSVVRQLDTNVNSTRGSGSLVATQGCGHRTGVRGPQRLGHLASGQTEISGFCPVKSDNVFRGTRLTAVGDVDETTSLAELADDLIGQIVEDLEIVAIHTKANRLRGASSRPWNTCANLQAGETFTESLDFPCQLFD